MTIATGMLVFATFFCAALAVGCIQAMTRLERQLADEEANHSKTKYFHSRLFARTGELVRLWRALAEEGEGEAAEVRRRCAEELSKAR